jgi:predicted NBD/HSP70 family sugar kinase
MIIAVDTGGTKTLVASFGTEGRHGKSHRFPTPKNTREYIETLAQLLLSEYDLKTVTAICIAVPGVIKNNVVDHTPNLGWSGFDLANSLKQVASLTCPIILQNDSSLAGLAEAHALEPKHETVVYLTVSTGIGASFVKNGVLLSDLFISECGHMMLEYDGILRQWEHFASGRAIYETYGRYAHDITDKHIWAAISDKISRGLLALLPLLEPEIVVVGGSIGTYFDHFHKTLSQILDEQLPEYIPRPKLVEARHTEEAVIYGCSIYANQTIT